MATMASKYAGKCRACGNTFPAGTLIKWTPTDGAVHDGQCPPKVEQVAKPQVAVEDSGVYVTADGSIVKVKANRLKTNTYGLLWTVIPGERLTEAGMRKRGEYVYQQGLAQQVAADANARKMTLDEAKAFILLYGICARCGRVLKAADSVERGIGPVCIKFFGGHTHEVAA